MSSITGYTPRYFLFIVLTCFLFAWHHIQTKPNLSFSSNLAGRTTREVMKGLMCPVSWVCGHFGTFSITWNLFFSVSQSMRGKHSVTVTVCPDWTVSSPAQLTTLITSPYECVPTDGMFNRVYTDVRHLKWLQSQDILTKTKTTSRYLKRVLSLW